MRIKVVVLFLLVCAHASLAHAGTEVSTFEEPNVNRAYCGKQVPFAVCRCAFQGQGCEVMNITQERAKDEIESKFRKWVGEQIESVAKSCIDGGGHWNTATRQCITCTEGDVYYKNKCVPPEKAGEGAQAPLCVSMLEFSKDWRSFSDFAASASVNDASDQVRRYYKARGSLAEILRDRQGLLFDMAVTSYLSDSVNAYLDALNAHDSVQIAATFTTLARDVAQLPEDITAPAQELFVTTVDAASSSLGVAEAVVPESYIFPSLDTASVPEKVEENAWDAPYETISAYGGAIKTATQRLSDFAPLGEEVPEFSEADVAELQEAHLVSLKGDKARTVLDANFAVLRLAELRQSAAAVAVYNEMEQYKSDEFNRAREQMTLSCEN